MLKINLLQTPGIELDGNAVILPFRRAEALLYYLAVKRSASRQELIALLWESDDEAKGLKNLRNALYTLKKALGSDVLISPQKATISLNPDWEIDCDYDRFLYQKDHSAYQAPFLSGFSVRNAFALDEWIHRTREKLHGIYLQSLELQARTARSEGRMDDAIQCGFTYLQEEPYDETMTVFVMKCLQETRQFAKATQIYQQLKELLSGEMGADPLESTTMFYYEILNHWNAATKPPADPSGPEVPVGRESIYNALRAAAFTFLENSSRRCSQLLIGETGSGKSELINSFLRTANFSTLLPIRCECMQSDREQPLSVWNRILRSLLDAARTEGLPIPPQATEGMVKMLPGFGSNTQASDPYLEDNALLMLSRIGRQKKLLIILDDLQWADIQSVQLLNTLLRHSDRGSLMLLLSSTWGAPVPLRRLIQDMESDGLLHRQYLDPLTRANIEHFLRKELGEDAAKKLSEEFHQESGGNLRLLISLTEAYRQNPDVHTSVQAMGDILSRRLGGLSEEAERVIRILSLFRTGIPSTMLLDLMDGNEQELTTALLELRSRAIVEELTFNGMTCYRFIHRRIRELVYERLSAYQRKELNLRVARLLTEQEDDTEELTCREIAYHFRQADDHRAALRYRLRALNQETIRNCEPFCTPNLSELRKRSPEELEKDAEECSRQMHSLKKSETALPHSTEMEHNLMLIGGRLALYRGNAESAHQLLGSLSGNSETADIAIMVQACEMLAASACYRQATELAERYVATGLRFLTRAPEPIRQARLYRLRGCCFGLRGDYDRADYYFHEAVHILDKQLPDPSAKTVLAAVYGDLGRSARCRNDFVHAGRWFGKAMSLLEETDCAGQVWLYVHYGRTIFAVDDHIRAQELFSQALTIARARGELWGHAAAAAYCAFFQMTEGDHELAAATLREAMVCADQMRSPLESCILLFVCTKIRRRLDLEQRPDSPLHILLPEPADDYARRGVRLCSGIPDVFEMQMLSQELRDGISSQLRYRSSDLYSKNKRFMSE